MFNEQRAWRQEGCSRQEPALPGKGEMGAPGASHSAFGYIGALEGPLGISRFNSCYQSTSKSNNISPSIVNFYPVLSPRCDSTRAMRVDVNYDLEYQGEEVRGLASEALNTGSRPRARLAEAT